MLTAKEARQRIKEQIAYEKKNRVPREINECLKAINLQVNRKQFSLIMPYKVHPSTAIKLQELGYSIDNSSLDKHTKIDWSK